MPRLTRESESKFSKNNTDNRLLSMTIYTDQLSIPVEEVVLSYDNQDAMADVGGFLGLLLGASFLSIFKEVTERSRNLMKK